MEEKMALPVADKQNEQPPRGASSDPTRLRLLEEIDQFRIDYQVSDSTRLLSQCIRLPYDRTSISSFSPIEQAFSMS
jgi:hypothetical protein